MLRSMRDDASLVQWRYAGGLDPCCVADVWWISSGFSFRGVVAGGFWVTYLWVCRWRSWDRERITSVSGFDDLDRMWMGVIARRRQRGRTWQKLETLCPNVLRNGSFGSDYLKWHVLSQRKNRLMEWALDTIEPKKKATYPTSNTKSKVSNISENRNFVFAEWLDQSPYQQSKIPIQIFGVLSQWCYALLLMPPVARICL